MSSGTSMPDRVIQRDAWLAAVLKMGHTPMDKTWLQEKFAKENGVSVESLNQFRLIWHNDGKNNPNGVVCRLYGWMDRGEFNHHMHPMGSCSYLVEVNGIGLWNAFHLNNGKKFPCGGNLLSDSIGAWACQEHAFRDGVSDAQIYAREAADNAHKGKSAGDGKPPGKV